MRIRLRAPRTRRMAVLAGSVAFHLLIFALVFGSASGALVSAAGGGGPQGPVIEVSLVGPSALREAPSQAAGGGGLRPLFAKYRAATDGIAVPVSEDRPSSALSRMAERLGAANSNTTSDKAVQATKRDGEQRSPKRAYEFAARVANPSPAAARASTGQTTVGAASTGELWGRIEPCWRNLSLHADRAVTLEVSLDGAGGLAHPPQVVRPVDALLDEQRLRAEARALAAVAACLPRGDLRFAGRSYRLEFQP